MLRFFARLFHFAFSIACPVQDAVSLCLVIPESVKLDSKFIRDIANLDPGETYMLQVYQLKDSELAILAEEQLDSSSYYLKEAENLYAEAEKTRDAQQRLLNQLKAKIATLPPQDDLDKAVKNAQGELSRIIPDISHSVKFALLDAVYKAGVQAELRDRLLVEEAALAKAEAELEFARVKIIFFRNRHMANLDLSRDLPLKVFHIFPTED